MEQTPFRESVLRHGENLLRWVTTNVLAGVSVYQLEEQITKYAWGVPVGSMDRNLPPNAGDTGSILDMHRVHVP